MDSGLRRRCGGAAAIRRRASVETTGRSSHTVVLMMGNGSLGNGLTIRRRTRYEANA